MTQFPHTPSAADMSSSNVWDSQARDITDAKSPAQLLTPSSSGSPTTPRVFPLVIDEATPHEDAHLQRKTVQSSPRSPSLDIVDPTPYTGSLATPVVERSSSPTSPWPQFEYSAHTGTRGPVFDPSEVRSIFPTGLPPRPAPKPGLFARVFKRQPKAGEDIELGGGVGGGGTGGAAAGAPTPCQRLYQKVAGTRHKRTMCVVTGVILVLLMWFVLAEISVHDEQGVVDGGGEGGNTVADT
jgi:hypothetical protein